MRPPSIPLLARPLLLINRLVAWTFHSGLRAVHHLPCPVISVGNLTSGGTGKTPTVQWLAEQVQGWGRRPAILLRGYGGESNSPGDEALLHLRRLPRVAVLAGRDRVATGQQAISSGSNLLILDDGFQYWRLHRDLDIVMVDAGWMLGARAWRHFPRESLPALHRAQVVLLSKGEELTETQREESRRRLLPLLRKDAVLGECRTVDCGLVDRGGDSVEIAASQPMVAFAGIAGPEGFFGLAQRHGLHLTDRVRFPDHHVFSPQDYRELNEKAHRTGAQAFLTTEKDLVRITSSHPLNLPLYALRVRAEITPAAEILERVRKAVEA